MQLEYDDMIFNETIWQRNSEQSWSSNYFKFKCQIYINLLVLSHEWRVSAEVYYWQFGYLSKHNSLSLSETVFSVLRFKVNNESDRTH